MLNMHMRIIYCSNVICVSHTAISGKVLKIENSIRGSAVPVCSSDGWCAARAGVACGPDEVNCSVSSKK
jgi:hypothetical protein